MPQKLIQKPRYTSNTDSKTDSAPRYTSKFLKRIPGLQGWAQKQTQESSDSLFLVTRNKQMQQTKAIN